MYFTTHKKVKYLLYDADIPRSTTQLQILVPPLSGGRTYHFPSLSLHSEALRGVRWEWQAVSHEGAAPRGQGLKSDPVTMLGLLDLELLPEKSQGTCRERQHGEGWISTPVYLQCLLLRAGPQRHRSRLVSLLYT